MTTTETREYVQISDGILQITISTAAKGTSLDFAGINQGTAALQAIDAGIGAVLLVGAGGNFCAGGDVRAFSQAPERGAYVGGLAADLHAFVRALEAAPVPVVVGVHGWAAGAGMSLVCAADVAIGGPSTRLKPAYTGIGFTPDGGMSWTLPRIVGVSRAKEIILTNATVTGEEAVQLGILSRIVEDAEVGAEAAKLARAIAAGPRSAYAGIRTLLAASPANTLSEQLDLESAAISRSADSPTGREGVDAFVEKREPHWQLS